MRLLVLGATGATGRLTVDTALAAGHEVVAYVRDSSKLEPRAGLTAVVGSIQDVDALAAALQGTDAAISTIGLPRGTAPNGFILDASHALVTAAKRAGVSRVVFLSAFGVGTSLRKASGVMRLMYRPARSLFDDKAAGEAHLTSSGLDWTLAYPGLLTNKPGRGTVHATDLETLTKLPGVPRISRADVASFLVDAATTGSWSRKIAVITTAN